MLSSFRSVSNTSEEFYKGHPYPKDFSLDIEERSLVFLGPLDHLQESVLGILFQVFILSRHRSIYWGYIIRYDLLQADAFLAEDNSGDYIPHTAQDVIDMLAEAMARVGFLRLLTSRIPGAVDAWIDSIVALAQMPILPRLPFDELKFFEFSPSLPRWLSREFTFANPFLYDPFYTDYLKYEAMEQEYYDELEDWGNDNFHDEEAEHNLSTWA